jgi:hypothetical protein
MSSKPTPLEITVSSSTGGKVQIVKFEYSEDYHFSQSEKWSIPEDWTTDQIEEFRGSVQDRLDNSLGNLAQIKVNELIEQRDAING